MCANTPIDRVYGYIVGLTAKLMRVSLRLPISYLLATLAQAKIRSLKIGQSRGGGRALPLASPVATSPPLATWFVSSASSSFSFFARHAPLRVLPASARHAAEDTPTSTKAREASSRTPPCCCCRPPRSLSSRPTPPPPRPCCTTCPCRSRRPILPIPQMARAWHCRPCPTSWGGILSNIDITTVRG